MSARPVPIRGSPDDAIIAIGGAIRSRRKLPWLTGRPGLACFDLIGIPDGHHLRTKVVVFLAGTTGGSATRSCNIPPEVTTILVPLINIECSEAEGDGTSFDVLGTCAKGFADDFTDLSLVIDGNPVSDLSGLR